MWSGRDVTFQRAEIGQVTDVLSVLDEVASWLHSHGSHQWPARFEEAWVERAIAQGETWLVRVGGDIAATLTLDWSDRVWSDIPGTAGYLHRMAVRRWAAGLGGVLLRWAADATLAQGRSALRLDCVASNGRLRAYYEAAGFVHCGNVMVGGAPGQRLDEGPLTLVSRYQRPLP
jgi:hypothetical protein